MYGLHNVICVSALALHLLSLSLVQSRARQGFYSGSYGERSGERLGYGEGRLSPSPYEGLRKCLTFDVQICRLWCILTGWTGQLHIAWIMNAEPMTECIPDPEPKTVSLVLHKSHHGWPWRQVKVPSPKRFRGLATGYVMWPCDHDFWHLTVYENRDLNVKFPFRDP